MLTNLQLLILKAAIIADPALNALPNDTDSNIITANVFNAPASPVFIVWKTHVSIEEVGDNIVGTELAGLTTADNSRLQTFFMMSSGGINPSLSERRGFFNIIFSAAGGVLTRPKLDVLWRRLATRAEKLFATGVGTDPSPATLTFEGSITHQDVNSARNLP